MKLTDQQLARGRVRFLSAHPDIAARIGALTQKAADNLGVSLNDLRELETMKELRLVAQSLGIDSTELYWSHIVDTAEELAQLMAERDAAIKRNLGI